MKNVAKSLEDFAKPLTMTTSISNPHKYYEKTKEDQTVMHSTLIKTTLEPLMDVNDGLAVYEMTTAETKKVQKDKGNVNRRRQRIF